MKPTFEPQTCSFFAHAKSSIRQKRAAGGGATAVGGASCADAIGRRDAGPAPGRRPRSARLPASSAQPTRLHGNAQVRKTAFPSGICKVLLWTEVSCVASVHTIGPSLCRQAKLRATFVGSPGAKHLYSQQHGSLSSPGATPLRRAAVSAGDAEQPKNKKEGGAKKDQRKGTRSLHFYRAGGPRPPPSPSYR